MVEDCDCSGGCVGGFGAVVQGGVEEDAGVGCGEEEGEEGGEAVVHFCGLDEEDFLFVGRGGLLLWLFEEVGR